MTIKEILAKAIKGDALSDTEKAELGKFDPDVNNTAVKDLQKQIDKLTADLTAATTAKTTAEKAVEDAKREKMTDVEKLQADLQQAQSSITALTAERDSASKELSGLKRASTIASIAEKNAFTDKDYLDYALSKGSIDLAKEDVVKSFMENLKKEKPHLFSAQANPGGAGGTGKPVNNGNPASPTGTPELLNNKNNFVSKTDSIIANLNNAPTIE